MIQDIARKHNLQEDYRSTLRRLTRYTTTDYFSYQKGLSGFYDKEIISD
ncbi:hypothetical protein ABW636_13820 [Aquimarina sp. 2201CG1-2-11]